MVIRHFLILFRSVMLMMPMQACPLPTLTHIETAYVCISEADELSLREGRGRHTDPVSSDQSSRKHTVYLKNTHIHHTNVRPHMHLRVCVCMCMCDLAPSSTELWHCSELNIKKHKCRVAGSAAVFAVSS